MLDPSERPRLERPQPKDEIELCNVRKTDANDNTLKNTTKSMAGAFVNQTDVPAYDLPGNFGVRALGTMPTDQREVFITQHANLALGAKCDDRTVNVPEVLDKPD